LSFYSYDVSIQTGERNCITTLHFLLHKRCVNDIRFFHGANGRHHIARGMVCRSIRIPHFNDIEPTFWADRETIDLISLIGGNRIKHARNGIGQEYIGCIFFRAAEGVASTTNVMVMFPQRRGWITHQEEHAIGQGIRFQGLHNRPKLIPRLHRSQTNERIQRPFRLLRGMEVERP
jgi:hypothetical protein